ncbi:hypothetical protein, partial [Acidovorax sp. SUPP3334]|uniref:hypothetical protein n=1 Tax=Acidovorax sp. SUPP3334 TaxID=2920881 RepID=UPI0024E13A07
SLLVRERQLDLRSAHSHRGISGSNIPQWHARLMPENNGTGHYVIGEFMALSDGAAFKFENTDVEVVGDTQARNLA